MKEFILDVCSHRGVNPFTATSIEFAKQELGNIFLVKYDVGDAWLDRMRSAAATQFLTHDWAPYMIFLDDDIVFSPQNLKRLLEDLKAGYRLVGGLYPTRTGSQLASCGMEDEYGGITLDNTIKEVRWLATGFMGFHKSLLQEMVDKLKLPLLHKGQWCECYPFFVFDNDQNMLWSEDWAFCRKAHAIGEKVYADTGIQLGHCGEKVYWITDAVVATKQRQVEAAKQNGILEPDEAEFCLKAACKTLDTFGVRYWIDSGTLLAAVRDNAFNMFDHDVDIRCFKEDLPDEMMPEFMAELYKNGFITLQQNIGERRQILALTKDIVMLDLKFCEHNDKYLWYYVWDENPASCIYPEAQITVHCFPIKFFKELGNVTLMGGSYPTPNPTIEYLEYHYGEKWREFKCKPEDVEMTDFKWDCQRTPPCAISQEQLKKLLEGKSPIKNKELVDDISEFLNKPVKEIENILNDKPEVKLWDSFKNSGLALDKFYRKDNDLILYDLIDFNTNYDYEKSKVDGLMKLEGMKILDFGCGIGTASLKVAQKNQVYGYDINPKAIKFCNFRKDKHKVDNVTFSTKLPNLGDFDFIMAIDVFEHIPELEKLINKLGKEMKSGAHLMHVDSFNDICPVHIDHSKNIDNWLMLAGFERINQFYAKKP